MGTVCSSDNSSVTQSNPQINNHREQNNYGQNTHAQPKQEQREATATASVAEKDEVRSSQYESDHEDVIIEHKDDKKADDDEKEDRIEEDEYGEQSEKSNTDESNKPESDKEDAMNEDNNDDDEGDKDDESQKEDESDNDDEEVKAAEILAVTNTATAKKTSLSASETTEAAIKGHLHVEYPNLSKVVRIFTSSTFTDTRVERNTLMEKIYPRLKTYCQERGYDFQVVDMRWGVRDEATDDHMTSEICMRELRDCQKLSTGPNFITFLGQKYGYRPFPPKIVASEFEKLLSAIDKSDDKSLLSHWFARDDNCVPAQFLLQSIRSKLPHYADDEHPDERKQDRDKWWADFERMQVVLRGAADKASLSPEDRHKYYMSVTEEEIMHGILTAQDPKLHCYWFKRVITDLDKHVKSKNARRFMDIAEDVDKEAITLLNQLKDKEVSSKLPSQNIKTYEVKWTENGIDPAASDEHKKYIERFCTDFDATLRQMIDTGIKGKVFSSLGPLQLECMQHVTFAQTRCAAFYGRQDLLTKIEGHIKNKESKPLVICGMPGSGKTSLLAKSMQMLPQWLGKDTDVNVVGRFIGTSTDSSSIHLLLQSLCQQMGLLCDQEVDNLDKDNFQDLKKKFQQWIQKCCKSKPVYIFLDSLDQLDDAYDGREMSWLPEPLPTKACLIMSAVPEEKYSVVPSLKTKYSNVAYLDVPLLGDSDINTILKESLSARGRQLQTTQFSVLKTACEKSATPLFLKITMDEALSWQSYTQPGDIVLKTTVTDVINALFDKVEKYHGRVLVRHALAYITCAKAGLSENEIEDIMSCDDEVLNDVYQYHLPPLRRLPPLLWVRIRADLKDYLTDRGADGIQVINWYHRQFTEVAQQRYLSEKKLREKCHSDVADFFLGKWANNIKKPFKDKKGSSSEADRLVPNQPWVYKEGGDESRFNLRKMSELPYHLIHTHNKDWLKEEVFCNFAFLYAKLRALGYNGVSDDFNLAKAEGQWDGEMKAVHGILQRSRDVIRRDHTQIPLQLAARLISTGMKNAPFIRELILQCQNPPFQCLTTAQGFLQGSLGSLTQKLTGHEMTVSNLGASPDGTRAASACRDVIKIWDTESGKELLHIHNEDCHHEAEAFMFFNNNQTLVCTSQSQFWVYDLRTGRAIQSHKICDDFTHHPIPFGFLEDYGWIVVLRKKTFVFQKNTWDKVCTLPDLVPAVDEPHHQQRDFVAGLGKLAVLLRAGSACLVIADMKEYSKTKQVAAKISVLDKGQDPKKFAVCPGLLPSGKVACLIYELDKYQDNISWVKVFDLQTGKLLKNHSGFDVGFCVGKEVTRVRDGSHILHQVYQASNSHTVIMEVDVNSGKNREVGTINTLCYGLMPLDSKRFMSVSSSSDSVVDIMVYKESVEAKGSEEGSTDNLVAKTFHGEVELVQPLPNSKRYIMGSTRYFALQIFDMGEMKTLRDIKIKGYANLVRLVTDELAVTLTHTDDVMVYDMKKAEFRGRQKKKLGGEKAIVGKLAAGQGKALLPSKNGLEILDVMKDTVETVIPVQDHGALETIITSKDGSVAAVAPKATGEINVIFVFDIKNKTKLRDINFKKQDCYLTSSASLSWDGKYLGAMVKTETHATVWDTSTGSERSVPEHDGYDAVSINFSKATNSVITGTNAGWVALFNLNSMKLVRAFKPDGVTMANTLYVSGDGTILACKGMDQNMITVHDLTTGERIGNLIIDNSVWDVTFSWNNSFMLVGLGSVNGIVQIYLHRPDKKSSKGQGKATGSPPIALAIEEMKKEPALFGNDLISKDFSEV